MQSSCTCPDVPNLDTLPILYTDRRMPKWWRDHRKRQHSNHHPSSYQEAIVHWNGQIRAIGQPQQNFGVTNRPDRCTTKKQASVICTGMVSKQNIQKQC